MLVSAGSKMAFVHVQKTGGRSVNRVLWENFDDLAKAGRRHAHLSQVVAAQPEIADYFVFGFVRNPWDRLVSWYSMISAAQDTPRHAKHLLENRFWQAVREDFDDFDDFVVRGVGSRRFRPKRYQRLRTPQTDYFSDSAGNFAADFIGRTERLDDDLAEVMAKFDIHVTKAPRVNTSSHAHYSDYYTKRTRDIVEKVYRADLDRFGYTF